MSPGQLLWSELPLTARVVASDEATAQVEVWSVVVIGIPTADSVPRQAWRTVTVDLAWVEGDWLVSGWSAVTRADAGTRAGRRDRPARRADHGHLLAQRERGGA